MKRQPQIPDDFDPRGDVFWPHELIRDMDSADILPTLIETQSKFLAILQFSSIKPDTWKQFLEIYGRMSAALFLRHIMLLSNIGNASLGKLILLNRFFPDGYMRYVWQGKEYVYCFRKSWDQEAFDAQTICNNDYTFMQGRDLTPWVEDTIMLLLHGSTVTNAELPDFCRERCTLGRYMGASHELQDFLRPVYMLRYDRRTSRK